MFLKEDKNEYGTKITRFICDYCHVEFSVCPAIDPERYADWDGCTAPECSSYDPSRDIGCILDNGGTLEKEEIV